MKEEYRGVVRWWLALGAFLVIAMVVVGGITRLTHSGLSMTDWKPISGVLPPMNQDEWEVEFENYKQFPEYKELHSDFTLSDFQSIFWWEFIHRILGRVIGIVFIIPYVFFMLKKVFNRRWNIRLLLLFALGGLQGFLGWFMVKSGLVDNPAVSHYRLAIHLMAALTVFSYIIWLFMDLSSIRKTEEVSKKYKNWSISLLVLVVVQILYGAFVAGLKAGLIVNTWPLMGNKVVSPIVGSAFSQTGLISLLEEPVSVQFIHRILPFLILIPIIWLLINSTSLTIAKNRIRIVGGVWLLQFTLGVITLLTRVPVTMGVLHQLGGAVFLGVTVYFLYPIFAKPITEVSRN